MAWPALAFLPTGPTTVKSMLPMRAEFSDAVKREALLRAVYQCEHCGARSSLEFHHGHRPASGLSRVCSVEMEVRHQAGPSRGQSYRYDLTSRFTARIGAEDCIKRKLPHNLRVLFEELLAHLRIIEQLLLPLLGRLLLCRHTIGRIAVPGP